MTTGNATNVSASGATLTATFAGVTTSPAPQGAYFRYGTSSSQLTKTIYDNDVILTDASGSFSAAIASLNANTTYYYQAVMTMGDGTEVAGSIKSFTTPTYSAVTADSRMYLDDYVMPAVNVQQYTCGTETYGTTSYYGYTTSNSNQMVVSHSFEYNGSTLHNYSLLYDKTKHAALWVAFEMNGDTYPWLIARSDAWAPDPAIPSSWQPDLSSAYQNGNTYSRGHQCASNDRRTTTLQTKQTSYYSNMTPQLSGFNGGMWSSLENDIQKIGNATRGTDVLYVVTGPIFESGYDTNPDQNGMQCAIPTKYFKCIMKVSFTNGTPTAAVGAAYLLNHQNSGATRQEVTIDDIETLTGFDFFAHVPTSLQNTAEAETHPTSYFPQKATSTSE